PTLSPVLLISVGLSAHLTRNLLASSWFHSIPPLSPYTLILRQFSSPAATCVAINTPLAPLLNLSNTDPSSSRALPSTTVLISAPSFVICCPDAYSAKSAACVPISPMAPAFPLLAGSVRQEACLFPSCSRGALNQPCGYST